MTGKKLLQLGWREWISLPDFEIPIIKAKIDTGARTSAIHAIDIETDVSGEQTWVEFSVPPLQRNDHVLCRCRAELIDKRIITDSGGHAQERMVVSTTVRIHNIQRQIELTLTDRSGMLFRMLLGRTALVPGIQINPSDSFLLGRVDAKSLYPSGSEESSV